MLGLKESLAMTNESLEKFVEIYKKIFKEELKHEEYIEKAKALIRVYKIVSLIGEIYEDSELSQNA